MSPSLDKHKPRSATEMLVEVTEQRDELARAMRALLREIDGPRPATFKRAGEALRKVPRVVFEKE